MDGDILIVILQLLATVVLIALNALFVFHEFSFVAIKPGEARRLEHESSPINRRVADGLHRLDHYIAVDQLGITMTSIAVGWIGQPLVARLLAVPLGGIGAFPGTIPIISAVIAFVLITSTQMVAGELMPKTVALRYPLRTAQLVVLPVIITAKLFHPLIVVLNGLGTATVRMLGFSETDEGHARVLPAEELADIIEMSARAGTVATDPLRLRRILHFSDLRAQDLMIPRPDVIALDASWPLARVLETAHDAMHTRYPVYEQSIDNIVGLVNIKDLLVAPVDGRTGMRSTWTRFIRPIPSLPETAAIEQLLLQLRQSRQEMALLVDEFGGTSGIVAATDIARQLFGDPDEIRLVDDGQYMIQGHVSILTVETALDIHLGPQERDYDTMAGLVMELRQDIPAVGDQVSIDDYVITVLTMKGRRITQVLLQIPSGESQEVDAPEGE